MRKSIRQRRWDRKHPAPPPTPDGMVYVTRWGRTELVPADEFQRACKNSIGILDELPEQARRAAKETGVVPDNAVDAEFKSRENKRTAKLGFGRAF